MEQSAQTTPVKSGVTDDGFSSADNRSMPFTTPSSVMSHNSDSSAAMECLTGSFTGMKLDMNAAAGGMKRGADRITVEGSPMVPLPFKQPNLNPTPYKFDHDWSSGDGGSRGIGELCDPIAVDPRTSSPILDHYVEELHNRNSDYPVVSSAATVMDKVLVVCSASSEHNTGDHQENMLRTALLCGEDGCLRRPELAQHIKWVNSDTIQAAPLTDLLRVHEYAYLAHLEKKSKATAADVANSQTSPPFYAPPGMLDTDTPLLPQSLDAAKRFCGAAMLAVDHIMSDVLAHHIHCDNSKNINVNNVNSHSNSSNNKKHTTVSEKGRSKHNTAFVIGRPPGHHAGPNGFVISNHHWQRPDMTSSGFCLLNTVAVAAAYTRYHYGRLAQRNMAIANSLHLNKNNNNISNNDNNNIDTNSLVYRAPRIAIVDIDIHHGNGTEEIVRNLRPHQVFLPLPSSWAPVSTVSYKPWLDESDSDEVLFSSVHLYAGERFYPCSGKESENSMGDNVINIELHPLGPGPWDYKARAKLSNAHREELCAMASAQFREKITSMLLPRIEAFRPDLLFISAGFDAHYDDNYHFLTEGDIHWVTSALCDATVRSGGYGVISVLEGGYSLSSAIPAAPKVTKSSAKAAAAAAHSTPVAAVPAMIALSAAVDMTLSHSTDASSTAAAATSAGARPVRTKAKKAYGNAESASPNPSHSAVTSPAAATSTTTTAGSTGAAHVKTEKTTVLLPTPAQDAHFKYAQRLGDGGLVKGVLAHVAALANKDSWKA